MSDWHDRVQHLVTARFRAFLADWLAELPPEGWAGTAADLEVV